MRFCHADTVSDQDIEVSIADAATQAIVPVDTPVEVTEEDGELPCPAPGHPDPIGIELEDPANDVAARPIPTIRGSSMPTATATPGSPPR